MTSLSRASVSPPPPPPPKTRPATDPETARENRRAGYSSKSYFEATPPVPNPATAKPYSVKIPGQVGPVTVEASSSVDKSVEKKGGYTTVQMTAQVESSASATLDLKKVSIGGGVSAGTTLEYEVKMKDADFERLKRGELPPPCPLKPETLPDKASVTMDAAQMKGWSAEASANLKVELGLGEGKKQGQGLSIQTERDGNKVKVTAGPMEVIQNGVSVRVGAGPASLTLTGESSLKDFKLRTAEFDLSKKEGRTAFDRYAASGAMPLKEGPGVSAVAKVEKLDASSKSSVEVAMGPFSKSIDVVPESNTSIVETTYPDGSKDGSLQTTRTDGTEFNYERHIDANGKEDFSKQKVSLFMKGMSGDVEGLYAHAYQVDQSQFDKNRDVYLSFDAAQATQLSQQARDYAAKMDRITGQPWNPRSKGDFFIDALAKAKNPGDVANALARFYGDRAEMGNAMASMSAMNGRTSVAGTVEARDRNT